MAETRRTSEEIGTIEIKSQTSIDMSLKMRRMMRLSNSKFG